jgi:hypothetical protein
MFYNPYIVFRYIAYRYIVLRYNSRFFFLCQADFPLIPRGNHLLNKYRAKVGFSGTMYREIPIKKSGFSDTQIVISLKEAEAAVALCRQPGFNWSAFHKWKARFLKSSSNAGITKFSFPLHYVSNSRHNDGRLIS